MFLFFFSFFVNKYVTIPNLNLANQPDLDKIFKVEVFVYSDELLRAVHLILGYNLLSSSFQVPKCVIRDKEKRLHLINIAV